MEKIGVIGVGVVGLAAVESFRLNQINVRAYDKFKNIGQIDDILDTDVVFLCLPTPHDTSIGAYDKSALHDVCSTLADNKYAGLVVIKSTIEPTTSQFLSDTYGLSIAHNPEFLTARTATEDFHNQKHIIIGATQKAPADLIQQLVQFYAKYYPEAEITKCTSTESEAIKIFCNCFYAVKVQFFNELYLLCDKVKLNYDLVKNIMLKNGWINPMHTDVPGHDGKLSYGGMCFPKDTNALLSFMKHHRSPHQVLEATVTERNTIRERQE